MINLLREHKVCSARDFNKIPNYCYNVDPTVEPLKRIVESYNLNFEVQCGLSNCHSWHKDGVIVELENGKLTNVGHICGNKFGEKFEFERKVYEDKVQRPKAIKLINELLQLLPLIGDKIDLIEKQTEVLQTRKLNFISQFPICSKELLRRAVNSDHEVNEPVQRTNTEIDDLLAASPYLNKGSLIYKEVKKGEILGLNLFNYNLQSNVSLRLIETIDKIKAADLNTEKLGKLIEFKSWVVGFEDLILEINKNISSAQSFFSEDNYKLLSLLSNLNEETNRLFHLKTSKLDEVFRHKNTNTNTNTIVTHNKKLNREQRRKFQFSSNNSRYNKSA